MKCVVNLRLVIILGLLFAALSLADIRMVNSLAADESTRKVLLVDNSTSTDTDESAHRHSSSATLYPRALFEFKVYRVLERKTQDAQIDLANLLELNWGTERAFQNAHSTVLKVSHRERKLLETLLTTSGVASLVAKPTLTADFGRKIKYFYGEELPSSGYENDGRSPAEAIDIGTKIEASARPKKSLAESDEMFTELLIELTHIDWSAMRADPAPKRTAVKTARVKRTAVLSLDQSIVLGGPSYDDILAIVTLGLVASEAPANFPRQFTRPFEPSRAEFVRSVEQLQDSTNNVKKEIRDLDSSSASRIKPGVSEVQASSEAISISTELSKPRSGGITQGDAVTLHVTVKNTGHQVLSNVRGRLVPEKAPPLLRRYNSDVQQAVGKLSPGESAAIAFEFTAEGDGYVQSTIEFEADGGQVARATHVAFIAKADVQRTASDRSVVPSSERPNRVTKYSAKGVETGWEESAEGHAKYTIRVGSGLAKNLRDGTAIQHVLSDENRMLREFRVVMGSGSVHDSESNSAEKIEASHGWQRNGEGGLDYYVQVPSKQFEEFANGCMLKCNVHPDVKSIDQIYIFQGDSELPRKLNR